MQVSREVILKLQKDPNAFFEHVLGINSLTEYQRRMNDTIAANSRTVIKACHDVGKSWDLARIVLWFGTCFPYSKIITTAPTYNQVKNILWSEIRSAHAKSKIPLGGVMNQTEWQLTKDGDWFALGFTPKNELSGTEGQGTQSSFQGFHAPYILVIFDEAVGVPANIWKMAEGIMTSANVKFVGIANPTSRACEFYKCFSDAQYAKMGITCFDSPNLIANGLTNMPALQREFDLLRELPEAARLERMNCYAAPEPHLLSATWVMGRMFKWGVTHPLFISKCIGDFPTDSDDVLMPLGIVEQAMNREYEPLEFDRRTLGVDVARFGSDSTVLTYLHGYKFVNKRALVKRDTTFVAGAVIAECKLWGWPDVIVVDETGLGGGVVDALNEAKRQDLIPEKVTIRGVQFGSGFDKETQPEEWEKYVNAKARMFDLLASDLKEHLCLPPKDDVYLDELPTVLYSYDSKGRMVIESKEAFKKRTGRGSPDHSDSLALANYGRYDELTVGNFSRSFNEGLAGTIAASLGTGPQW